MMQQALITQFMQTGQPGARLAPLRQSQPGRGACTPDRALNRDPKIASTCGSRGDEIPLRHWIVPLVIAIIWTLQRPTTHCVGPRTNSEHERSFCLLQIAETKARITMRAIVCWTERPVYASRIMR